MTQCNISSVVVVHLNLYFHVLKSAESHLIAFLYVEPQNLEKIYFCFFT